MRSPVAALCVVSLEHYASFGWSIMRRFPVASSSGLYCPTAYATKGGVRSKRGEGGRVRWGKGGVVIEHSVMPQLVTVRQLLL